MKKVTPVSFCLSILAALIAGQQAYAATITKANNTTALNSTGAWVGGVLPGSTDIALWDSTVTSGTAASSFNTGANVTWGQIAVTNPGAAITFINNTITLNGVTDGTNLVGIDLSSATQNVTFSSGITLGSSQVWKIGSGVTLQVNGTVTNGANTLALAGAGNFQTIANMTLSGVSTLSGSLSVQSGTTTVNGVGTLANILSVSVSNGTLVVGASGTGVANRLNTAASLALGGTSGGGNFTLTTGSAPVNSQTMASLAIGSGFNVITNSNGAGSLVFTGTSGAGYTRSVGGFISFALNSLDFTNAPTALGGSSVIGTGGNEILMGAALNDTDFVKATSGTVSAATYSNDTFGSGLNTNITVAGTTTAASGVTMQSLRFSTNANQTLTLSGTNTVESGMILNGINGTVTIQGGTLNAGSGQNFVIYAGGSKNFTINSVLADNAGATGFEKYGGGTVNLGGNNTFTGQVYLQGGFVQLNNNNALGQSSATAKLNVEGTTTIRSAATGATNVVIARDILFYGNQGITFDTNGAANSITLSGNVSRQGLNTGGTGFNKNSDGTLYFTGNTVGIPNLSLNVSGGTLDITGQFITSSAGWNTGGNTSGNIPVITVHNNGILQNAGDWNFVNGANGRLTLNIQDNAQVILGGRAFLGKATGTTAIVNQSGGLFQANLFAIGAGGTNTVYNLSGGIMKPTFSGSTVTVDTGSVLNLNGGTIQPGASGTTTLSSTNTLSGTAGRVVVQAGGGTLDTGSGVTLSVTSVLEHDTTLGSTADGGLTKTSAGTVSLTAANTFTGRTLVSAGTLALANINALQNSPLNVSGAGTVSFTVAGTNTYTLGGLQGTGTLAAGANSIALNSSAISTVTIPNGTSFISSPAIAVTTTGTFVFAGTLNVNFSASLGTGSYSFNLFDGNTGGTFSTVSVAGSYAATLNSGNGYSVTDGSGNTYNFDNTTGVLSMTVSAIPEPPTYAAIFSVLAVGGAFLRRRRLAAKAV